ncbi:MAG: helicase-related protein, partial [Vicinamibacterales bacterium]
RPDAAALRTAASARIELLPYQLEPTLALLQGHGARLLIADEVGLGKTVQAMLAVSELRARSVVTRVLVLCPPGLRDQWADECASRFDLPLALLDHAGVRRVGSRHPPGVNPWMLEPLAVASIDYVKRPEVLPAVLRAHWDMVIVDEAHGACGNSDRRDAVTQLCARTSWVVLLTATPHSGDDEAFASLCAFGRHDDGLLVFRRSRLETGRDAGRRVHTLRVHQTAPERRMHAALATLTRAVRQDSTELSRHVWLLLTLLHKRALSSPFALAASVERRLQVLDTSPDAAALQLRLPLDDQAGELDDADSAPMWSAPAMGDVGRERRLLEQVLTAARDAAGAEGKLHRLGRLLRRLREPVIVFTEYRDTLMHLRTHVAPHAAVVHGGMTREQRRAALDAFPSVGVLLATDAAGEGLNLQGHCRTIVNLELPWNPMRLEQRVGRVDRIGQRARVHVVHLVADGTGETRLLERLAERVRQARARVGAPDPLCSRPEWTEESSAALVVLDQDTSESAPRTTNAPPSMPLTRLVDDGELEAARVRSLRLLSQVPSRSAARPETCDVLESRTRASRTRTALAGRSMAVFRSRLTDGSGRLVATHVSAVLGPPGTPVEAAARAADVHASRSAWSAKVREVHARFTAVRAHRARRIAGLFDPSRGEQQPGLFDRRLERERRDTAVVQLAARAGAEERLARVESSFTLEETGGELVLLLSSGPDGAHR